MSPPAPLHLDEAQDRKQEASTQDVKHEKDTESKLSLGEGKEELSAPVASTARAQKQSMVGQPKEHWTKQSSKIGDVTEDGRFEQHGLKESTPILSAATEASSVRDEASKPEAIASQPRSTDMADLKLDTHGLGISSIPCQEIFAKPAGKLPLRSQSPPLPPPKDDRFLSTSNNHSRATSPTSQDKSSGRNSEDHAAAAYTSKYDGQDEAGDDSQVEIQSIMEQFDGDAKPGVDDIMSPRLELKSPHLSSPSIAFPPRRSSLAPVDKPLPTPTEENTEGDATQAPPPRTSSLYRAGTNTSFTESMSPNTHAPSYQPIQPTPEPESDLPFDFHRFLEQLRHRTADPIAKFLRSFLHEFGKKQWMVHEQVKIIGDFLDFISKKMAQCEVWRSVSDAEFDNASEGMEKLVMNRLYAQTFSPAILPPQAMSPRKGRRRQDGPLPGRRGQHQEDVERDEVLAQKIRIYKWVKEDHLDIKPVGDKGRKFLHLAQQELRKIKSYRAPRDKIICILNCCKVIFGFLRTSNSDQSADAFVPLLIYTVLQANPDHLVSNVQYILRFRNQDKLGGEAGYYISSLMGAVQFIEGLDKTSLTISDAEFDKNVEAAVSAIAEGHAEQEAEAPAAAKLSVSNPGHRRMPSPHYPGIPEKTMPLRPELTQRNSMEGESAGPGNAVSDRDKEKRPDQRGHDEAENAAVTGLLRSIQRPLSMVGRIFSDSDTHAKDAGTAHNRLRSTPQTLATRSSTPPLTETRTLSIPRPSSQSNPPQPSPLYNAETVPPFRPQSVSNKDAALVAARQAEADSEQAQRIYAQEQAVVVETLAGMFPQLDRGVIYDVVREKEGRVGLAVDACLALANP